MDRDYAIKEKDEAAGYVLFEITDGARAHRASLELVKTTDGDGRAATRLALSVQDLPRYFEAGLLDKLTAKLSDERGAPPPPPARKPPGAGTSGEQAPPPKDNKHPGDLGGLPAPPTWGPDQGK